MSNTPLSLNQPQLLAWPGWVLWLPVSLAVRAQAAWFVFVPLTLLAVAIPVWWLVEFSRRGLAAFHAFSRMGDADHRFDQPRRCSL